MRLPRAADAADAVLEATIVGSFTKIGYGVRSHTADWDEPAADLTGQTAVVTGGTSGRGFPTARGLLDLGADVVVTGRSAERAVEAADKLNQTTRGCTARGFSLDTASFESIAEFVSSLASFSPTIDMIARNSGALTSDYTTDDRAASNSHCHRTWSAPT